MASTDLKKKSAEEPSSVFHYSHAVLSILLLITTGATLAYYQNAAIFADGSGTRWTGVVFLIGLLVSLVIFGMTHRDAAARHALHQKTRDLIASQNENQALLAAEQGSRISAEQANRAKSEFLALVSHELKTPLNAIAGWNRILKTKGISEETRDTAVEKIDKNLRLQASIVEELLNFSDIMSSGFSVISRTVRIKDIFETAVSTVSQEAFDKGVALVAEDKLNGEQVLGDQERLKIALVNVLSNAVKFTPPGGSVIAKVYNSDGCVKCIISDTGLGIPPEFLPHVFDQYRQSDHATTRRYGGLGLGLTIANHIITLHQGTIEAESPGVGNGAKFTISLPIRK
ncbi:MAG TPA: HAMP domain-containing sensor histidine kinase [Pyrinomonadaceae bacterium]|nr:HAMP domain-containing sensor histidine kinase [Pyrinomonadaceae bacterium]